MTDDWNVAVAFKRLGEADASSCLGVPHALFHWMAPALYSHFGHCEIVLRAPSRPVGDRVPEDPRPGHTPQLVKTVYTIDRKSPVHTRTDDRPYYHSHSQADPENLWTVCSFTATPRELARLQEFLDAQVGKSFHRAGYLWAGVWASPVYTPSQSYTHRRLTGVAVCHCTRRIPELKDLPKKEAWFCSELVAAALIYARVCTDPKLEPRSCTPDHLYHVLQKHLHRPREWS